MDINLNLTPKQFEIFQDDSRFKIVVAGRRFGKTMLQVCTAIAAMFELHNSEHTKSKQVPEIALVMPTRVMAERILWLPLLNILNSMEGGISPFKVNLTKLSVEIPSSSARIRVLGSDNPDSLRGLRLFHAGIDEFQDCSSELLPAVIRPALADTPGSTLQITGTPKGKLNHFFKVTTDKSFKYFHSPTWENPLVDREELKHLKNTLSPLLYRQEIEAEFTSFGGAVFGSLDTQHGLSPFELSQLRGSLNVLGVDWGDVNPAYSVLAYNKEKDVWTVQLAKTLGDGVNAVPPQEFYRELERIAKQYKVRAVYCDPSRPSSILELRSYPSLSSAVGGLNSIAEGNSLLNNLFHQNRLFVPLETLDYFMAYRRKKLNRMTEYTDDVEPGQKDHYIDATRYALYSMHIKTKGKYTYQVGSFHNN